MESNYPAGQEDIDFIQDIESDPASLSELSKEELAKAYATLEDKMEEWEATRLAIKEQLFSMIDADSEEVGRYLLLKTNKVDFTELTIEKARELGLTKTEEKIDQTLVKKAWKNGVDLGKVEQTKLNVMRRKKEENV